MKKISLLFIFCFFVTLNNFAQKIYINSIPKAGTHLLMACINVLTGKKSKNLLGDLVTTNSLPTQNADSIFCWHVKYSGRAYQVFKNNDFKGVFIYRDPRDRLISAAFWILKHKHLLQGYGYKDPKDVVFSDLIKKLIPINNREYESYLPWVKVPLFYSLKFEDLVGSRGGGNDRKQFNTVKKICSHLRLNCDDNKIKLCCKHIFGKPGTFREGKLGSWRKYFTAEHKSLFKKVSGDLLIKLGYEKNNYW